MKKKNKFGAKVSFWITFFIGVTFAYFMWLSWNKLTDFLGDSLLVWAITGGIVLLAILLGHFSFKRIVDHFA